MNTTAEKLRLEAQAPGAARDRLAKMGYDYTIPAVISLTRDNRLYERDDVKQQTWVYILEAIAQDKGIGDVLYYIKWFTINRLRDWMGMSIRRHAFMLCTECGARMTIKPQKHRICTDCGAVGEKIESKSFIDTSVETQDVSNVTVDDYSSVFVEEFMSTLKDDREREILLGYMADVDRAQLAVRFNVSTGRISQIVNRLQTAYMEYSNDSEGRAVAR